MAIIAVITFAIGLGLATRAAAIDARTHRLPNIYTIPLALIGLFGLSAASLIGGEPVPWTKMGLGAILFGGPWLIAHLASPNAIGFGDIKLSLGLGIYLGWLAPALAIIGLFAASLIFSLAHLATRTNSHHPAPFGPALVAGAALATLAYPLL